MVGIPNILLIFQYLWNTLSIDLRCTKSSGDFKTGRQKIFAKYCLRQSEKGEVLKELQNISFYFLSKQGLKRP